MKITVLTAEEVNRVMDPVSRSAQRRQEMVAYREAIAQLRPETPGGLIALDEGETPHRAMLR